MQETTANIKLIMKMKRQNMKENLHLLKHCQLSWFCGGKERKLCPM